MTDKPTTKTVKQEPTEEAMPQRKLMAMGKPYPQSKAADKPSTKW